MAIKIRDKKTKYLIIWIVLSTLLIPIGSIIAFGVNLNIGGKMGYGMGETWPHSLQIAGYCLWGALMGAFIGVYQWLVLRKEIGISSLWILACVAGAIISESFAGIVLWSLGINRTDLGYAQGGSIFAEGLIFLFSGVLIGLFQYPLLNKFYNKAKYWILACSIGWGMIPVAIILFGGLALGLITGAVLFWILQPKQIKQY